MRYMLKQDYAKPQHLDILESLQVVENRFL